MQNYFSRWTNYDENMFLARLRNVKQADKLTYSYQIPAKTLKQIGWRTVRLKCDLSFKNVSILIILLVKEVFNLLK